MVCKQAFPVDLKKTEIRDSFWSPKQQIILDTAIDYQEKILNDQIPGAEKSHAVANFRIAAGLEEGEFYGMVFQDSDVAKWLEGVAYSLTIRPDPDLEKRADADVPYHRKRKIPGYGPVLYQSAGAGPRLVPKGKRLIRQTVKCRLIRLCSKQFNQNTAVAHVSNGMGDFINFGDFIMVFPKEV